MGWAYVFHGSGHPVRPDHWASWPTTPALLRWAWRPTSHSVHGNGFTGGVQVGYNYQMGSTYHLGGAGVVIGAAGGRPVSGRPPHRHPQ